MTTNPKLTSLAKLEAALRENGWSFAVNDQAKVKVKDPEKAERNGWSSRARYVPTKLVDGHEVKAGNKHGKAFTAKFTADGAFLADSITGDWPFSQGMTLTKMLAEIEAEAPAKIEARIAANEAEREAREKAEEEAVAAAHAQAKMALLDKQAVAVRALLSLGLTEEQAEAVIELASVNGNALSQVAGAAAHVEQTGRGWGRGNSVLHGHFKDGKRISEEEWLNERSAQQSADLVALGEALAR